MDEMRNDANALMKADYHSNENVDVDNSNKSDICDNHVNVPWCTAISTTSETTATPKSGSSSAQLHANLWNTFLKSISQRHQHSGECKYPNPDVPEFYPRNTITYFNACAANSSDQTTATTSSSSVPSSTKCIAYKTAIMPKNQLVSISQQCFAAATTTTTSSSATSTTTNANTKSIANSNRELVHGASHYYWTIRDTSRYWLPGGIVTYKSDQLQIEPAPTTVKPTLVTSDRFQIQTELNKKDKQLVHLNNVVKALIDEIWRVNELLMTYKNKDQLKNDLTFAIDEFLKPSSELGFHCDDCCDKFKHFVIKIFKQQERKIAKQQAHNKNAFVNYLVSVIENSLQAFNKCGHVKCDFKATLRPTRHDVATQTDQGDQEHQKKSYKRPADSRRSKHQATKIYRNRNYCKVPYDLHSGTSTLDAANRYSTTMQTSSFIGSQTQNNRNRHKSNKHFQPKSYSYSSHSFKTTTSTAAATQPTSLFEAQATNPIQLIHQKYKNLNCRLEGIPDKNLVKFSYIVNGKEYSAIASTKKEAQYHCAWHVLGSTKHK